MLTILPAYILLSSEGITGAGPDLSKGGIMEEFHAEERRLMYLPVVLKRNWSVKVCVGRSQSLLVMLSSPAEIYCTLTDKLLVNVPRLDAMTVTNVDLEIALCGILSV